MALEVLCSYDTGLQLSRLKEVSELVDRLSGVAVHANKAVVGYNAFRHEAGMVVAGVLKNPYTAESYDPELVGQKRGILLGKKSGLVSVKYKAGRLGLGLTEPQMVQMLQTVKEEAVRLKRAVTDAEFIALAKAEMQADCPCPAGWAPAGFPLYLRSKTISPIRSVMRHPSGVRTKRS
ncbi:homocitrate synthase/isopropylmalate synthase family protein [Pseudaminobacter salicylatoxidans]|uniref:homocitrate synthase/isopropylmalate synthase family protein n=1 Tax=Pseudaminobacter salicylatoxidans TaxID=93369 RepID=UPI003CC6FF1E